MALNKAAAGDAHAVLQALIGEEADEVLRQLLVVMGREEQTVGIDMDKFRQGYCLGSDNGQATSHGFHSGDALQFGGAGHDKNPGVAVEGDDILGGHKAGKSNMTPELQPSD